MVARKDEAEDLANYQHVEVIQAAVAAPTEGFGALVLQVEGRVVACNIDAFRAGASAFLSRLPKPEELNSDQDFANAESAVKACTEAESKIKAAKDAGLAQMSEVDTVFRVAADSSGQFFHREIRGKYQYTKMEQDPFSGKA